MHVKNVSLNTNAAAAARAADGQVGAGSTPYDYVTLSFSVSGTYDIFRTFLADLESSLRLVDVTSIAFSATPTGIYEYTIA